MRYGICTGIENAGLVKKLGYDYIELSVTKTMGLDPAAYAAGCPQGSIYEGAQEGAGGERNRG